MVAGFARGTNPKQATIFGRKNLAYEGPDKASDSTAVDATNAMSDFTPEGNESEGISFAHLKGAERIEEIQSELIAGMNSLVTDEKSYEEYVDFIRSGYTYSASNQLLLHLQKPGHGNFKTYKQWAALGYQVAQGTKSATVLRPSIVKEKVLDDNGKPIMDDNGKPKTKEKLIGYSGYPVFSAQDLDPSVKAPPEDPISAHIQSYRNDPDISDNEAMRKDLEAVMESRGIEIAYRSSSEDPGLGPTVGGYAFRDPSKDGKVGIVINSDFEQHSQTFTLAHEVSHVLCGHMSVTDKKSSQDKEVEAETMAYSISRNYGLDCRNRSFAYLKGWSGGDEKKIRSAFTSVSKGAKEYYSSLEKVITGTNAVETNAAASAKVKADYESKPRKKKTTRKKAS